MQAQTLHAERFGGPTRIERASDTLPASVGSHRATSRTHSMAALEQVASSFMLAVQSVFRGRCTPQPRAWRNLARSAKGHDSVQHRVVGPPPPQPLMSCLGPAVAVPEERSR